MASVTIEDPERYDSKKVDGSGKLYVGTAYAGKEIVYLIERARELDDE